MDAGGSVYTSTNGASANVLAFRRAEDGALARIRSFPSGGRAAAARWTRSLQYAVILSADHHLLFTVNAARNDVTSYRVARPVSSWLTGGPRRYASGEPREPGRAALVLNAGDNTVPVFQVNPQGKFIAIPQGTRRLASGAGGASTIHFSADGRSVIVTRRTANRLETLAVWQRAAGEPVVTASSGAVPLAST